MKKSITKTLGNKMTKTQAKKDVRRYSKIITMLNYADCIEDVHKAVQLADFTPYYAEFSELSNEIENYCDECIRNLDKEFPGIVEDAFSATYRNFYK